MTEDPDESQDAVRRLLAEARADEPMPAEVAARLDDVLAGLGEGRVDGDSAEGPEEPGMPQHPQQTVVSSLGIHRRRRAAGLLVAAAAIVVGGVVVAQHLPPMESSQNGGDAAASGSEDRGAAQDSLGSSGGTTQSAPKTPLPGTSPSSETSQLHATVRHGRVVVRPDRFTDDALAARRLLTQDAQAFSASGRVAADGPASACAAIPSGTTALKATYQRAPALLVFHPPASHTQVVDLYVCGTDRAVRSVTLPSP